MAGCAVNAERFEAGQDFFERGMVVVRQVLRSEIDEALWRELA
jgi:hypothetical protein